MAIIKNEAPQAQELPPDYKPRVVVKFKSDVKLSYSGEVTEEAAKQAGGEWNKLASAFQGITLTPYFSQEESALKDLMQRAPRGGEAAGAPDFTSYYAIECPSGVDPESVAKMAAEMPNVETAYVEGGPTPPPVDPSDDPRNPSQGYLDAAPAGIDARWAWAQGIDGSGIGFVDLEQGWTLNHEDLAAAGITIISGTNTAYHGHGTAVLGEVMAVDNTLGDVGIATKASGRVVSQYRPNGSYNTADAILSAVGVMAAGDVLLLEAQTRYTTSGANYVPVEVEQAVFDAIKFATTQGIVVVEAGGNGSVDLDAFQTTAGKQILNRNSADFRDSGAIMVGAASSAVPHTRMGFSNFGSRIDCYGWGENIDTTGDGWMGTATNLYTAGFGGTSGASPIVTGAALIIQSWRAGTGNPRYTPAELRGILTDTGKSTASANPAADRIGVMPDLGKIIPKIKSSWWWWKYFAFAWAWVIVIGALMITPGGVWCIKCGRTDPFYLGDPVIIVMGLVTIALGAIGVYKTIKERNSI